jgi:hypothetical protein
MPRQTQARQALEDHQVAIARAYERGKHLEDIAKKYDVSTMTVHNWLKTLGYKHSRGRGRYPKAMAGRARDLASRGWGVEQISSLLKVRSEQIEAWVLSGPIENPKGFKQRSPQEKEQARKKKLAQLEKRRAKKKKGAGVPDPARLEQVEEESKKAKRPRGRPRKEKTEEPYPPPRHRCNKHWTEPEERFVLELIREGKQPAFIYNRMRASKQRQRRIWRKYGGKGDPPNFPPPKTGRRPPEGPAPTGAPTAAIPPPEPPAPAEPPALPASVVEALSGELADRARAEAKLAELKKEREKLEKQAKLEAKQLKKLRTSKERREDLVKSLLGEKFGDALSNRVLEGSYEHLQLGLKPGSRKPIELPTPEELGAAKTDKEIKRLVGGAVRQLMHPANRKRLARLLLDATLEYQNWLEREQGDVEELNQETQQRRQIIVKVLREISDQYDLDQDRIERLTQEEADKKSEAELEKRQSEQKKKIDATRKQIQQASAQTAKVQRKAILEAKVDQINIPTLAQFVEIGREAAMQAFDDAPTGQEDEAVGRAVAPIYEARLKKLLPPIESMPSDAKDGLEALEIAWTESGKEILARYADVEDLEDDAIQEEYKSLQQTLKAFNGLLSRGAEKEEKAPEPKPKKRERRKQIGPRPLKPADYYAQRFVHQQYAPNRKFYRFGPAWKDLYPAGSRARKLFTSATKKELKELSQVLEQRFGFPNKLMIEGKVPAWFISQDKSVPEDVRQALREAVDAFPEIINRLRQRRDQLYKGKAKEEVLKELKPSRPKKSLKASEAENLDEKVERAREKYLSALKVYEDKLTGLRQKVASQNRSWDEQDESLKKSYYTPVLSAEKELLDLEARATKRDEDRRKLAQYEEQKQDYEQRLRKATERKMLTEDIAEWVGKLGQAVKAKEELDGSTDPDLAVKLDAKFQNATSEYRKIWNAMSEPDRIILSNNLKFADLRGRPTDRGVRYAKYLMKKYGQDLKRNPGLPWMRFCQKRGLC